MTKAKKRLRCTANGALNVLAKIVSSTREDENGDNNMQLEALSVMFNLVKAGYGSAQSRGEGAVLLGTNELDFVTEKLLGYFILLQTTILNYYPGRKLLVK